MSKIESETVPAAGRLVYRQRDLQQLLGISRNAIERMMAEEGLCAPIKLGPRSKGWVASEVHDWLDRRKAERDASQRPERPCL